MLDIRTLNYKIRSKDKNKNTVVDLTRSSVASLNNIRLLAVSEVTSRFVMRPDLIAQSYYGDANKYDFILKFNGISNPFSIFDGQELLIPDADDMEDAFATPKEIYEQVDSGTYANFSVNVRTNKDKKRLEALQEKAKNKEVLPSNMNNSCEENVTITNTKIVLGSCISDVDPLCDVTTTRGRLRQKLIENKISKY